MIRDLISRAVLVPELGAGDKNSAIEEVLDAAIAAEVLPKKLRAKLLTRINEREAVGTTGIGNGVAVPHVKEVDGLDQPALTVARAPSGLDWGAIDGREVVTVFMLASPKDAADSHLQVLRWISGLARDADFRRFVQAAGSDAEIRDLLQEMSES